MKIIVIDGEGHLGFEWTKDRQDMLDKLGTPYEIGEVIMASGNNCLCPDCGCCFSLNDFTYGVE